MIKYKTKFIREINNNSIKLVYELSSIDHIDEVELPMVTSNKIKGLLETTYCSIDNKRYIKYNISSKISLYKYLKSDINRKKLLALLLSIVNTLLNIEDYLIIENHMIYDINNIYVDVSTLEVFLICLPIKQDTEIDIKSFMKNIIMNCKFEHTDNTEYVLLILNSLNSEDDFILSKFKTLIKNLRNNKNASENNNSFNNLVLSKNDELNRINKNIAVDKNKNSLIYDENLDINTNNHLNDDNFINKNKQKKQKEIEQNIYIRKNIKKTLHDVKSDFNRFKFNISKKEIKQYEIIEDNLELERKNNKFDFDIPNINNKKNSKKEKKNSEIKNNYNKKENKINKKNSNKRKLFSSCKDKTKNKNIFKLNKILNKRVDSITNNLDYESSSNLFETYEDNNIRLRENHNSLKHIRKIYPSNEYENIDNNLTSSNVINNKSINININPKNNYDNTNAISSVSMETVFLNDVNNKCLNNKNMPYIIRKKTNDKISIDKNLFKIGKEKNYVDYEIKDNNTISRTHADIIKEGEKYYIQDNNSKNHTYVNYNKIGDNKELLSHDCIITLSNEEFIFKLF